MTVEEKAAYDQKYREVNRERIAARKRTRRLATLEDVRANDRAYYAKTRERRRMLAAKRNAENPIPSRVRARAYYLKRRQEDPQAFFGLHDWPPVWVDH